MKNDEKMFNVNELFNELYEKRINEILIDYVVNYRNSLTKKEINIKKELKYNLKVSDMKNPLKFVENNRFIYLPNIHEMVKQMKNNSQDLEYIATLSMKYMKYNDDLLIDLLFGGYMKISLNEYFDLLLDKINVGIIENYI